MKLERILSFVLCVAMLLSLPTGCGGGNATTVQGESAAQLSPQELGEPMPDDEYERARWYGFINPNDVTADSQITERDMVNMLSAMIGAYDKIALEKWSALTETTSTDGIYRDYGAMMLLYAAEVMDCASFTNGVDPLGVSGNDLFG
ncbi:MAG: hypothetical protein IKC46_11715, partial [Lachnospiraceae bacterium]|nr:hypothetical protein [Lachnospiraceae bacterium]